MNKIEETINQIKGHDYKQNLDNQMNKALVQIEYKWCFAFCGVILNELQELRKFQYGKEFGHSDIIAYSWNVLTEPKNIIQYLLRYI